MKFINMKSKIYLILTFLFTQVSFAQKDSLFAVWNDSTVPDSSRIDALEEAIWSYYLFSEPDSALYFTNQIIEFSESKNQIKEIGVGHNLKGNCYFIQSEWGQAIDHYNQAIDYFKKSGDPLMMASPYNNLGACYKQLGDLHNAILSFRKSLRLNELKKDMKGVAGAHSNLGTVHLLQEEFDEALECFAFSMKIRDSIQDLRGLAESYSNIGVIYSRTNKLDSASSYFHKSLSIDSAANNIHGMISEYLNLSDIYKQKGFKEKEQQMLAKALSLSLDVGDKKGVCNVYAKYTDIEMENRNYPKAKIYAEKCLRLSQEMGFMEGVKSASSDLYVILKNLGYYRESLKMHELYVEIKDSLNNESFSKDLIQQQFKYEYEKKTAADSLVQAEQLKMNNLKVEAAEAISAKKGLELEGKRKQQIFLYLILILVALFGAFMYNRFKLTRRQKLVIQAQQEETEKQKEELLVTHLELEESHKEISDSITYARGLQQAILPEENEIKSQFEDAFILFKPKDVVSGDFYWFEKHGDVSYVAVADCTGHGVPGALVSIICSQALHTSLRDFKLTKTSDILDKTREIIISTFAKSGRNVKDGMDIVLCAIKENGNLQYAGANNPLWIVRKSEFVSESEMNQKSSISEGVHTLLEFKSDKQPVGLYEKMTPFSSAEIQLMKGDYIYLFTDGYADQFGGDKGKKMKYRPKKEFLLSLVNKDLATQKSELNQKFESWRGDHEQIDDVCMIGVRI